MKVPLQDPVPCPLPRHPLVELVLGLGHRGGRVEDRDAPQGWWTARYRMPFAADGEPRWSTDLILADRVVAPALVAHRADIALWRVHRRAAADATGHQFSFAFYAAPEVARQVFADLQASCTLRALADAGVVREQEYSDTTRLDRPGIADTSDRSWSPALQVNWPFFIMGVSDLWLGLVTAHAAAGDPPGPCASVRALQAHYDGVSRAVEGVWEGEGGHALLHHLSGVFAYRSVAVHETRLMTF